MPGVTRRQAMQGIAAGAAAAVGCNRPRGQKGAQTVGDPDVVIRSEPLAFPWQTQDPFLFCVHHDDHYPAGNDRLGPAAPLAGRQLGMDFEGLDGWRMYHGLVVPGFPQHPHRGFETVTVVRRGLLDHSDSLGAAARYGEGDVQWLTAGRGILHAEMFPLLRRDGDNPLELFQIWLNLPRADKFVDPYFSMLWRDSIPAQKARDEAGRTTTVTLVAGRLGDKRPPSPPPSSWAARSDTDVAIWTVRMDPGARWMLPAAAPGTNRSLYFFRGKELRVGDRAVAPKHVALLRADRAAVLENGPDEAEALILQGRPIGEPVVQYGPFVMTTREEIAEAFSDYRRTEFGGWPWPSDDPVHPREKGRFARLIGGKVEQPA
jgi:redox-sensitive bicupin YhaK (pirin superfamily)